MEVQVRSEETGLHFFGTIKEAMAYADTHSSCWKISFDAPNGERVRLVKAYVVDGSLVGKGRLLKAAWTYEPILPPELVEELANDATARG